MKHVTLVDARMGRGKSTAAIRYMNERKGEQCFLYITPYLSEVDRVCDLCNFDEPGCDFMSKSTQLKTMMARRRNIASTHSLFSLMDDEALDLARENGYSLIVDESIQVIKSVPVSQHDLNLMCVNLIAVEDDGSVIWRDPEYIGKFDGYKQMAEDGALCCYGNTFYEIMSPKKLLAFDEVIMMTYIFEGQLQRGYLDYYGFTYDIVGIERDEDGYRFSDKPDSPPPIDYSSLITVVGVDPDSPDAKLNDVGRGRTALSVNWFNQRRKSHKDVKTLRACLDNFFRRKTNSRSGERLWTTFKENEEWLLGQRNRYAGDFLQLNARATNAYRETKYVAYLANRFINPNIAKFFASRGVAIDVDKFALSEMLQFIWRSAIRDDKPITLYVPSKRMRTLLLDWIEEMNKGAEQ